MKRLCLSDKYKPYPFLHAFLYS